MRKTQKKHWINGHQIRGGWHHSLALSLFNIAVMFTWGTMPEEYGLKKWKIKLKVELYKLV